MSETQVVHMQELEITGLSRMETKAPSFVPLSPAKEKWKLVTVLYAMFLAGVNDAATGALIPYIQTGYDVGLLFVAIVYLANFGGWLVAAFTNTYMTARFGMGGVLLTSSIITLIAYALNCWKPPFPLFACSFFFSGLGTAYMDAQGNTYVASMDNAHRWLGIYHAVYGVGALISPLVATALASQTPYWYCFYIVVLGCAVLNLTLIVLNFRDSLGKPPQATQEESNRLLKKALSNKAVLLLSLFFFLYVGAEVTASGWVVEFLISVRNGSPSQVGFVASGFWGGLALGRVALADITFKLGERRMVFIYILIAIVMQLLFWLVPNIIANAIVISLLGFIIAPFFPVGLSILTKLLPKDLHVTAIGFSSAVGQAGSAAFPFLTGAVASQVGVSVLQPIMIALFGGMFIFWALLPRVKKQAE